MDMAGSMNLQMASKDRETLSVVAVKAFGDLVIAADCIGRRSPAVRDRIEILLGTHLRPLFEALATGLPSRIVDHDEPTLPSLFTWKKDGAAKAVRSALGLHKAIRNAGLPKDRTLLFDHLGPRERFVTFGWSQVAMPRSDNIYRTYDRFLDQIDPVPVGADTTRRASGPLRIFPGSRVPAKNLPRNLIEGIVRTAEARGIQTELMLLDGERPDLETSDLYFTKVPRSFDAMIAAVRGAGWIVGADSMPAHIAEYTGRAMFVFSPVDNRYWLPRTAYAQGWDALFEEGAASAKLSAFIDAA